MSDHTDFNGDVWWVGALTEKATGKHLGIMIGDNYDDAVARARKHDKVREMLDSGDYSIVQINEDNPYRGG